MAAATAATASASTSPPYPCAATGGPNADAAAIGWLGNAQGATACLGGSFYVPNGINTEYGFGVYNYTRTTWTNSGGYLPPSSPASPMTARRSPSRTSATR